jgi:hypothetical protein
MSDVPLAVAVDVVGHGQGEGAEALMTYAARPWWVSNPEDGGMLGGSPVAYGPVTFSEYQGWDTRITVQNLSDDGRAKVKVVYHDRSGDIIATQVDWVCPASSRTFRLPPVHHMPGNWVGSVRVESTTHSPSREWWMVPLPVQAVATLIRRPEEGGPDEVAEALAYELLPEGEAFDWDDGRGDGGLEAGTAVIAVPRVRKRSADGAAPNDISTELAIANLAPVPGHTDFVTLVYDQNGLLDYVCHRLNERQVEYVDLEGWGWVNPGFHASMLISATHWDHTVIQDGQEVRDLVALGAVLVQRTGTILGTDVPGDETAAITARALPPGQAAELMPAALAGLDSGPLCPPHSPDPVR